MKPLTLHTCKLTDEQATALDAALRARHWQPRTVPSRSDGRSLTAWIRINTF